MDSGANTRVKYVSRLPHNVKVLPLTIADGKVITCASSVGVKGMPMSQIIGESDTEILPLLWLIDRHCHMSSDFRTLVTPKGRTLQTVIVDRLPYLTSADVLALIDDLPDADVPGRSGDRASLFVKVAFTMRLRSAAARAPSPREWKQSTDMGDVLASMGSGETLGGTRSTGA